jgi:hypothetical protein
MGHPCICKDNKMPKANRHPKKHDKKSKIVRTVKQRLIFLISALSAILFVFTFKVGEGLWTVWMVEQRLRIVGILGLVLVCLIVLSPFVIEYSQSPRALSGPGKNPYIDP